MGCDIHVMTERKRNIDNTEKWVNIDHFRLNPFRTVEGSSKWEVVPIYSGRNYNLFSFLANVRNRNGNDFISEPRGLPPDVSEPTKNESDSWGIDGHSHSYFTLEEIKDFLKEHPAQKFSGMMTPENAELVDRGEMPYMWSQSSNSGNLVFREWTYRNCAFDNLLEAIEKRKREEFWIFDEEEHPEFDDKIRIVFWFDN